MKNRPAKFYQSFKGGAGLIAKARYAEFRQELMNVWGIQGMTCWYKRLRGESPLTSLEREAAEKVFARYGVRRENIWDKKDGL